MSKPLPPLSQRMMEFIRPDFAPSDDLPSDEIGYSLYVLTWNLAVLQIDSPPVAMVNRHIQGFLLISEE